MKQLAARIGTVEKPKIVDDQFLHRVRGYLNHLAITCDIMLPLAKGFHNTIDSWRDNRDVDGWRSKSGTWNELLYYWLC